MMNGDNLQEYFSDYIDGEMSQQTRQDFEGKLKENPEAQATIERMRIIRDQMRRMPIVGASPDFERRLHQRIHEVNTRPFSSSSLADVFSWRNAAAVAAVVVIVSLSSMFMWNGGEGDEIAPSNIPSATESNTLNSMQQRKPAPVRPQISDSETSFENATETADATKDSLDNERRQQLQKNLQYVNDGVEK